METQNCPSSSFLHRLTYIFELMGRTRMSCTYGVLNQVTGLSPRFLKRLSLGAFDGKYLHSGAHFVMHAFIDLHGSAQAMWLTAVLGGSEAYPAP